jgi:transposase
LFNEQLSYYEKELKRTGVTRNLLWQEYRLNNANGYSCTQFCYHLQQYFKKADVSMIMELLLGDKLFIDFTGKKMCYYDTYNGHQI